MYLRAFIGDEGFGIARHLRQLALGDDGGRIDPDYQDSECCWDLLGFEYQLSAAVSPRGSCNALAAAGGDASGVLAKRLLLHRLQ